MSDNFDDRLNDALEQAGLSESGDEKDNDDNNDAGSLAALARGMRIGVEFVGGIGAGIGVGWLIDYWAGTQPIFLVIFLFVGFGAGLLNMYRAMNTLDGSIGLNREAFKDADNDNSGSKTNKDNSN